MAQPDPLWGLLYESTATHPIDGDGLQAILDEAHARNGKLGVTGWLTYAPGEGGAPGTFTQYIEGPRSKLHELFYGGDSGRGIVDDPRHRDVEVIQEGAFGGGPPGARLYPEWMMEWVEAPRPLQG